MNKGKESTPHIGIFGRRNIGKSSFVNCITGQEIAIVSDVPGTTTDPVKKSYEILGFGPVILIDTAGIDDEGNIGTKRVQKSLDSIKIIDLGILLISNNSFEEPEKQIIFEFEKLNIPYLIIHNKSDLFKLDSGLIKTIFNQTNHSVLEFSSAKPINIEEIISRIKTAIPDSAFSFPKLIGNLIKKDDIVLLITPIDTEAPEGRMILPQVQVLRDVLDNNGVCIVVKETEVENFLKTSGIKPKIAITDSQVFKNADIIVPKEIPLTGFSVLYARYKGNFEAYLKGTPKISDLKDEDKILLLESCTHHVSCDDIGRFKLPKWIKESTGKNLEFKVVSGLSNLPEDIHSYAMVIQCGGCMITRKQILNRLKPAIDAGIPVTNYGMAIAWTQGVYKRAIEPFVNSSF